MKKYYFKKLKSRLDPDDDPDDRRLDPDDPLEKYWRDEKKGLNIKDSTNVERIKRGLEPILFLSRKPIAWEVKVHSGSDSNGAKSKR